MTRNKEACMTIRLWVVVALATLAAVPASALAGHHDGKAKSNAAKECKAERGTTDATREAFAKKYGTKGSKHKNAFGKCVSRHVKAERAKRKAARSGAVSDCRKERDELGVDAFRERYGSEHSKRHNAFGKCVSQNAKERLKAEDHPKPERSHRSDKGKGKP
jgi:hypothetical protein